MGHKRPKSKDRVERDQRNRQRNKTNRLEKFKRQREKWANDVEYQKKQAERKKRLEAKAGYSENIKRGIKEKEEAKINRRKRYEQSLELKRRNKFLRR